MSDRSKCKGQGCPQKNECNRYTSKPVQLQVYEEYYKLLDGGCEYFIGINNLTK